MPSTRLLRRPASRTTRPCPRTPARARPTPRHLPPPPRLPTLLLALGLLSLACQAAVLVCATRTAARRDRAVERAVGEGGVVRLRVVARRGQMVDLSA